MIVVSSPSFESPPPRSVRRRLGRVGILLTAVIVAGCSDGSTTPPPTTASILSVAEGPLTPVHEEGENGAPLPRLVNGIIVAYAPKGGGAKFYRSEVFWGSEDGDYVRLREGDVMDFRVDMKPTLGRAGSSPNDWVTVWQLQGPLETGEWPAPPLTLHVRGATWRLGGGGFMLPSGEGVYHSPFTPYDDDQWVNWRLRITISKDPDVSIVDAWLDGRPVVRGWHPPGGTVYPRTRWLGLKSGLYTGSSQGRPSAAVERTVMLRNATLSLNRAGVVHEYTAMQSRSL